MLLYGGSFDRPNMKCTCPAFIFQGQFCRHCKELWGELGDFAKMNVVKHDELTEKPWMK